MDSPRPLRIIIVGAGIAGISLGLMLEKIGLRTVEFVILEAHDEIAPQVGAGFGCNANGLRILDQLGVYHTLFAQTESPIEASLNWMPDGTMLDESHGVSGLFQRCVGYPMFVVDRQQVLLALYSAIRDKSRIIAGARISRVDEDDHGVSVTTDRGRVFAADILIGVDGVHSAVRREMWRIGNERAPGTFPVAAGLDRIRCRYRTIFGISDMSADPRIPAGGANAIFGPGRSTYVLSGDRGRVYWFTHERLPEELRGDAIPKYTEEDKAAMVARRWNDSLCNGVRFSDLYETRVRAVLVPAAEHLADRWHNGRILILGDAAHKLHPVTGQGGMMCLEDGAAFVNALTRELLLSRQQQQQRPSSGPLSLSQIKSILAATEAVRKTRAGSAVSESCVAQDLHSWKTLYLKFVAVQLVPRIGFDFVLARFLNMARAAPHIEALPVPRRPVLVGFDDVYPEPESRLKSLVLYAASATILVAGGVGVVGASRRRQDGGSSDGQLAQLALHETASFAVVLVEGWRRRNQLSPVHWPILWAVLLAAAGPEITLPLIYLASLYSMTSAGRWQYLAPSQPVVLSAAWAIFPLVIALLFAPTALLLYDPAIVSTGYGSARVLGAAVAAVSAFGLSHVPATDAFFGTRYLKHLLAGYSTLAVLISLAHHLSTAGWMLQQQHGAQPALRLGEAGVAVTAAQLAWLAAVVSEVCHHCGPSLLYIAAVPFLYLLTGPGSVMVVWAWRERLMAARMSQDGLPLPSKIKSA